MVLDASVLIAHLSPGNAHHHAATRLLLDAAPRQFLVHALTLAEVLVGGVRVGQGSEMAEDIDELGVRTLPSTAGEPLRLARLRVSTGLKLPDCCVLDAAQTHGADLATFDGALAAAAAALGTRTLP